MTDETTLAFGHPLARAAATAGTDLRDRISVRDYVREVEIGAFTSERGVTQRVRFNVVLEVSPHAAAVGDDVDQVLSYDTIIQGIAAVLAAERINLLETLAERIAERCLIDPRAHRVFLRIEKLDRIPGALGVEIVRSRVADAAQPLRPVATAAAEDPPDVHPKPCLILVPADAEPAPWRKRIAALNCPVVVCLDTGPDGAGAADDPARRVALLQQEIAAWRFAGDDPRFCVVASRTELDWALGEGLRCVWAPTKIALDTPGAPETGDAATLFAWFAEHLDASARMSGARPVASAVTVPPDTRDGRDEVTAPAAP
ncbi:MAG: dihydroneopterin aldolase [Pseudomonadota bacterium]